VPKACPESPEDESFPAKPQLGFQKAADIHATSIGGKPEAVQTFPILQPGEDWNDFQVGVRASVLRRARERLSSQSLQRVPVPELLLGTATLTAGASLSALVAEVDLSSIRGGLFYILAPIIAVGTATAYGFMRHIRSLSSEQLAKEILRDLPDPEKAVEVPAK
jgi:hypothetical protein